MQASLRTCLPLLFGLLTAPLVNAEPILDRLPADTLGFALVRNLAATSGKIERVTAIFQDVSPTPIPAPLDMIKAATGLGAGVDEQGSAVLALLPGEQGVADPRPLFLVAVSDYQAFAQSIGGDPTGEISRVNIAGEEVLAAKVGDFAALMNVEHRDQLESLAAFEPPQNAMGIEPLRDWLATTDVSVTVTPLGLQALVQLRESNAAPRQAIAAQTPQGLHALQETLAFYEQTLRFLGAEVQSVAAGLSIDDNANVKFAGNAVLSKAGKLAGLSDHRASEANPLTGYAKEPFVATGGFPISPEYRETAPALMREILQQWPELYGFENFTEQDWAEVEDSWKQTIEGLQSFSSILYLGEKDDPLLDNIYIVLRVDDARRYVDSYEIAARKWNELVSRSTSDIEIPVDIADAEVAGQKGLRITEDILKAGEDPNVPGTRILMKALVGEDGVSEMFVMPAGDDSVVIGMADKDDIAKIMAAAAKGETGLEQSAEVQTATKLLNKDATLLALVSPEGLVAYISRVYNTFLAPLGPGAFEIPEYPDSPPIGLTLAVGDDRVTGEVVWPSETLSGLATYIKKWQQRMAP